MTVGVLGAILLVFFAGPWRTGTGTTLACTRDEGWRAGEVALNPPQEPDACDLFVLCDHERDEPTQLRLRSGPAIRVKLVRLRGQAAAAMRTAIAERDRALSLPASPRDPAWMQDSDALAQLVDAAELIHHLDHASPGPYHAALGVELARHDVTALVIDDRSHGGAIRLATPAMCRVGLVERVGRTDAWTDGPRDLQIRPGDPGLLVGALCVALWWAALGTLMGLSSLALAGAVTLGGGFAVYLARPTLEADPRTLRLRVGPLVLASRPIDTVTDVIALGDGVGVVARDTKHNLALRTASREEARQVAEQIRAAIAHQARAELDAEAFGKSSAMGASRALAVLLPPPRPLQAADDGLLVEGPCPVRLTSGELRIEPPGEAAATIDLEQPFRALLSRSEDVGGVPLLHLELRQSRPEACGWSRVQLSSRVERRLPGLDAVPQQGVRGVFVPLDGMLEVLAVVRGAMLAHDGCERWI